ncbi:MULTISPECIES: SDR family NAD(P)-dependent oxidoreductase [unclassified Psychrobacillus]|uniref:SDR family NAD(P)-dependent oxidoreductase n=1 Tax=unclassified Psychrobacillus TaxID=2636677 RepID=UPI001CDA174D|nr:SDR family NAD(P)-dependent oxidoreductase [Psychrobacillus sp. AK 1817]
MNELDVFGLKDKVVVVTGGNRGIGNALVIKLEKLGAKVAYINLTGKGNNKGIQFKANVTSYEEMENALFKIEKELGPIYGIVSNAGITRDSFYHKISPELWNEVIDVNLIGAFNTTRPIINKMYERQEGSIVFVSSIVGESGNLGQTNYSASKAGIIGFSKSLAKEGARKHIRSNVVAPGFTETSMTENLPEKVRNNIINNIPFKRFAKPDEIAWSIIFLLSPVLSSYITGEVIRVNGGQLM